MKTLNDWCDEVGNQIRAETAKKYEDAVRLAFSRMESERKIHERDSQRYALRGDTSMKSYCDAKVSAYNCSFLFLRNSIRAVNPDFKE